MYRSGDGEEELSDEDLAQDGASRSLSGERSAVRTADLVDALGLFSLNEPLEVPIPAYLMIPFEIWLRQSRARTQSSVVYTDAERASTRWNRRQVRIGC